MDVTTPSQTGDVSPPDAPGQSSAATLCPVCRSAVGTEDAKPCPQCHAPHHADCWDYNGGCGVYGCTAAPPTRKLTDIEIPASYWGQSEKECPACHNRIQAAAVRCRFCGTVFATARPQQTDEFQNQRSLEADLPKLRRRSIWLLVFSVIPFTAAFALLFGGMWYAFNRNRLENLPTSQRAIAKIALGVAAIETLVLIAAILLSAATGYHMP